MAITQHRETIEVPAGRGTIYDRTGEPLAIGEQATTVYADPRNIVDAAARRDRSPARRSASTPTSSIPVLKDRTKGFVYVARKADPTKAAALNKREIPGLGFYPEELRTYPQGAVASHVLGFAGTDNHGLDGLERSLDKTLSGRPGFETIVKDPFGRAIDVVTSRPERAGKNVTLTIDHQIQSNAEQILAQTVTQLRRARRRRDRDGSAHRRDPRDGELPDVQLERLLDGVPRCAPQPRRDRRVRARLDVQDRDDRRRARGQRRLAGEHASRSRRRSRSPTASSTRPTCAAPR